MRPVDIIWNNRVHGEYNLREGCYIIQLLSARKYDSQKITIHDVFVNLYSSVTNRQTPSRVLAWTRQWY